MKRTYEKPEIIFEDFSLSTNIAGDCEYDTNVQSQGTCGIFIEGVGTVFLTTMAGCNAGDNNAVDVGGDGQWNSICYHNPSETANLFNS